MVNNKALSIGVICYGNSLNFAEGLGNLGELKKITRENGEAHTYASRQSVLYSLREILFEDFGWYRTPVERKGSGEAKVIQFARDASIKQSEEMDLLGYMKTGSNRNENTLKRNAVMRLSHATSLEAYRGDIDFLTNMGMAARSGEQNNLSHSENHQSLYAYTVSADLSRVGRDENESRDKDIIYNEEKASRVKDFLEAVKLLYREIRGRSVNMTPVFVIGGLYPVANPFFDNRLRLVPKTFYLDTEAIKSTLNIKIKDKKLSEYTKMGLMPGVFNNENKINNELTPSSVEDFFDDLKGKIDKYYGVA